MRSVALSPAAREEALRAMAAAELDVLVIGGGVVGAGAALDAATRGLSVGLVEARDFASGTSSRSSKLIHGGLRYLEMLDFRLVAEALAERGLLIDTLAPHLVRPVPFLYPLKHRAWERLYAGSGVALYDTLSLLSGRSRGVPHHRHLTRRQYRRAWQAMNAHDYQAILRQLAPNFRVTFQGDTSLLIQQRTFHRGIPFGVYISEVQPDSPADPAGPARTGEDRPREASAKGAVRGEGDRAAAEPADAAAESGQPADASAEPSEPADAPAEPGQEAPGGQPGDETGPGPGAPGTVRGGADAPAR